MIHRLILSELPRPINMSVPPTQPFFFFQKKPAQLPTKLPKGMSARFRVGTEMANAVKELGYMTEIGYNTFLYSNEAEARQLLMWLVERLPKEASEATLEVLGLAALFNRQLAKNVGSRLGSVWTPPYVMTTTSLPPTSFFFILPFFFFFFLYKYICTYAGAPHQRALDLVACYRISLNLNNCALHL